MTTTLVKRPARIVPPTVEMDEIAIAEPPTNQQAPPAAMGLTMILMPVMAGVGSLTAALANPGNPIMAIAGFATLLGSITVGIVMLLSMRMGPKKLLRESRERYLDYIEELRHTLRETISAQKDRAAWCHPEPRQLLDVARTPARRWERRRSDRDYLSFRMGIGDQPIATSLELLADTGPLNDFDRVCLDAAIEVQGRYATVHNQPVTLNLRKRGAVSIVGDVDQRTMLAQAMLSQAICLQSPSDVRIAVVRSPERSEVWEWVKWLPHTQSPDRLDGDVPSRLVASSVPGLLELIQDDLASRVDDAARARGQESAARDHLIVVIDGTGFGDLHGLEPPDSSLQLAALGVHVLYLVDTRRQEPDRIDDRIDVTPGGRATLASTSDLFTIDHIDPALPRALARQLSPLRLSHEDRGDGEEALAETVGLPEVLGVDDPATLESRQTWRKRPLHDLLRVPIGIGAKGGVVLLDLKESAHGGMGPHGMVVGATGSGKSEMLRTMLSSLVIGHPPDRLALMLVDFKGGATFAPMEGLPHIAGMVTNLQDDLTLVDRMRDALYGEIQRRQEVLKAAGNLPNVTAYQDLIDAGEDLEPLPHLLVIIDEFSELLTAKEDFAELFVAIGRIGRSIGVHLLLATQKLDMGKIRGLESHLSYRVSLRTFSESESRDAIGVPDAYHLPPEPGSGYLKVDTTVFERFKAALVSSPYVPPSGEVKTEVPAVPYVAVNGLGAWIARAAEAEAEAATADDKSTTMATKKERSVLDVLVQRLIDSGAHAVRKVWLPPLPEVTSLDQVCDISERGEPGTIKAALGVIDEPEKQAQYTLDWDFAGAAGNLGIFGAPQTGKSMLLRTIIASLGLRYSPEDVVIYALDFGGGALRTIEDAPHVATITPRTDPERITRTLNDVQTHLEEREELFRQFNVSTPEEFRRGKASGKITTDAPADIFLMIDGYGVFREEYDTLDYQVGDIVARGLNYGIHVIVTATQSMDIRMRMQPAFGGRVEFRLNDDFDSQWGRKVMEQVPKGSSGRGVADPGLLWQAALPRIDGVSDDEDLREAQDALIAEMRERWGDAQASRVEVLPTYLTVDDIPPAEPEYGDIPVGVIDRNLQAIAVDFAKGQSPHLQIYGDGETGKTNLLKLLIRGQTALHGPDHLGVIIVDNRRSLLDVCPPEYLLAYSTNNEETATVANSIAEALRQRLPGKDVTSEQLKNRSWWEGKEILFIVDDYDLVSTSSGNPLNPLVDYFAQGRDLGFNFVMARRMGGFARAQFEPVIQRLTDLTTPGFIFSGDRLEGRVIGNVTATVLPHGRALYANRNGLVGQVQVAHDTRDAG